MKESDLYLPIKALLESQGYLVKSEIQHCDVVAVRGSEAPVVVELKRSLNLKVILQAVDRLSLTSKVYIGIYRKCKSLNNNQKGIIKMLRMLGLGLLTVDQLSKKNPVEVVLDPGDYTPKKSAHRHERMLGEFALRVGDPNVGGQEIRKGVVTAYRQRALAIAYLLEESGPTKASQIARVLDQPKARDILYKNVYGWFERVAVGHYSLSPRGAREIHLWDDVSAYR